MGQMPMFANFGAAGMGMNDMSGMNMGMGFGGNFGGNWNGQQAMGGNFGAGYYPNAGYNQPQMHQGAYGNHMHNQHFQTNNYQNRFQGHRGNFARGARAGFGGVGGLGRGGGHHVNQFQGQHQSSSAQAQYGASNVESAGSAQALPDASGNGHGHVSESARESEHPTVDMPKDQSAMPVDDEQMRDASAPDDSAAITVTNLDTGVPYENGEPTQGGGEGMQIDDGLQQGSSMEGKFSSKPHVSLSSRVLTECPGINPDRVSMMASQTFDNDQSQQYPMDPTQAETFYPMNNYQAGFPHRGRGGFRGRGRGRGGFAYQHQDAYAGHQDNFTVVAGVDAAPPINAPTGPKAMREGKPNTGFYSRSVPPTVQPPQSAIPEKEPTSTPAKETVPSLTEKSEPQPEPEQPARRSRSRSSSRKRKYRQRSTSATAQDDEASERRRERRRHHEEKYEDDRRHDYDSGSRKDLSRASSPKDDSRSKHRSSRSHRDSDRDARRDRHRHRSRSRSPARDDQEYSNGIDELSESSRRRSRRGGRDRGDREREREREKDKDKDRKRSSRRDRSASPRGHSSRRDRRDRERDEVALSPPDDIGFKIKGSRSAKVPPSAPKGPSSTFAPPTGPRGHAKPSRESARSDRDRAREEKPRERDTEPSSRRPSLQSAVVADTAVPTIDIHAQEREARNRERMLKEQQRRESASTTLGKKSRGSIDEGSRRANFDPPSGPRAAPTGPRAERGDTGAGGERESRNARKRKRGRANYKYEDEGDDERRAARVEEEREAGRWD